MPKPKIRKIVKLPRFSPRRGPLEIWATDASDACRARCSVVVKNWHATRYVPPTDASAAALGGGVLKGSISINFRRSPGNPR